MLVTILFILAVIFFIMAGAGVPKQAWQWHACACLVIALYLADKL